MVAEIEKHRPALENKIDIQPGVAEAVIDELRIEMAGHGFGVMSAGAMRILYRAGMSGRARISRSVNDPRLETGAAGRMNRRACPVAAGGRQ